MNDALPGICRGPRLVSGVRRALSSRSPIVASGLRWASIALAALLLAYWVLGSAPGWWKVLVSIPVGVLLLLNLRRLRIGLITRPFLKSYRRLLPTMSATEREALDAGTVWWDGELFTGGPLAKAHVGAEPRPHSAEQAFLDGPARLCAMLDDWDITHRRADMPPAGVGLHQGAAASLP